MPLNPIGLLSCSRYTHTTDTHACHPPPTPTSTHLCASCCSCASWCSRLRAFSCLRWSFHDLEATLRANSLCLSSFSLCWCEKEGKEEEEEVEKKRLVLVFRVTLCFFKTSTFRQRCAQMASSKKAYVQLPQFSL